MTSLRLLMKEPSKPKRDFLRENKRQVRKIEELFRETKICDKGSELRNHKFANIQPKVQTRHGHDVMRRPATAASTGFVSKTQKRPVSASWTATCDEGIQCCEDSILSYSKDMRDKGTQTEESPNADKILAASSCSWDERSQLRLPLNQESSDFEIAEQVHQATQRTLSSGSAPTTSGWNAFVAGDKAEVAEEHPYTSNNPLSQENSAQTLTNLRVTQNQLVVELNKLPVRSTTLRVQNRRREIDAQLDKIETLIAGLTRPF